jgi:hypothetical protein
VGRLKRLVSTHFVLVRDTDPLDGLSLGMPKPERGLLAPYQASSGPESLSRLLAPNLIHVHPTARWRMMADRRRLVISMLKSAILLLHQHTLNGVGQHYRACDGEDDPNDQRCPHSTSSPRLKHSLGGVVGVVVDGDLLPGPVRKLGLGPSPSGILPAGADDDLVTRVLLADERVGVDHSGGIAPGSPPFIVCGNTYVHRRQDDLSFSRWPVTARLARAKLDQAADEHEQSNAGEKQTEDDAHLNAPSCWVSFLMKGRR